MDGIQESLSRAVGQLLGRSSGPMHFRLVIQPVIATALAIRAGLRDARAGQAPFLWTLVADKAERRRLIRSGGKDIGKIVLVATVLDTVYQFLVLREFHLLQTVIVVLAVAVLPYAAFRGLVTRLARSRSGSRSG